MTWIDTTRFDPHHHKRAVIVSLSPVTGLLLLQNNDWKINVLCKFKVTLLLLLRWQHISIYTHMSTCPFTNCKSYCSPSSYYSPVLQKDILIFDSFSDGVLLKMYWKTFSPSVGKVSFVLHHPSTYQHWGKNSLFKVELSQILHAQNCLAYFYFAWMFDAKSLF